MNFDEDIFGKSCQHIFILICSFSVYGSSVTVWGAENSQETDIALKEGIVPVRDAITNKTKNLHVRIENGEIFADAENISLICGANVEHNKKNKTLLFDRNGYYVTVYLNSEEAVLSNREGAVNQQFFLCQI